LSGDANILAGNNGSYKSTILKIVYSLCSLKYPDDYYQIQSATLCFEDGTQVKYMKYNDSLLRLKKDAQQDEMLLVLAETVKKELQNGDEKQLSDHVLKAHILNVRKGNKNIPSSEFKEQCIVNIVSTFDVPLKTNKGEKNEMQKSNASSLDSQLDALKTDYAYYLSDLSKQMTDIILKQESLNKEDMEKIYADNSQFISLVDECFRSTGKSVDLKSSKLQFQFENGAKLEDLTHLSSGEKQMLVVLLTVLLQKHRESILIMDEPEISMHLDWQLELLNHILKLNSNCQILLSTHSPGIILEGWQSHIGNMTDLLTKTGEDKKK
jgi:predicted ATPase